MTVCAAPRTAIEKIVARHAIGWTGAEPPRAGDFVTVRPVHVMTHDNTSAVIPKFRAIAGPDATIEDPSLPVFAMDHDIQNHTPETSASTPASARSRRGTASGTSRRAEASRTR